MTDYSSIPEGMNLIIEVAVAVGVAGVFIIMSLVTLRERHRDVPAWHVHTGAAIQGAVFGIIIGFVLVPMRIMLMQGELPSNMMGVSGFGFLLILIALRRGLFSRLPFLGPQVKAYRRASLRRSIEGSQKQLDKLTPEKDAS
ncbi:MAG: hypothetical protein DHS20C05_18460 [Hyphococcus sp.]|nr:MAG: hypothetical protein DHS20C05_18460 [Marinicaulis sp.]